MFKYPYGDSQQLNLDWILSKLKELENQKGSQITADLETISNALISASFSSSTAYNRSDIVFHNGKLYRANVNIPAPGESWNPAHWDEIMLGDTVSNLVTYLANLSNNQVFNSSNVPGTHTSDALNNLKSDISNLTSNKAEYLNLGNINPADYPTRPEQIEQALNLINIYDKPVIFYYASWGRWSGIALKYYDGQNGYIIASFPGDKSTYFGYLVNGTFTVHRFADSSDDSKNMSNVSGSTVTDALNNLNGAVTSLDNGKVARSPVYITSLTELDDYVTSEFFIPSADITIGSTGVTIPAYSRCIFINHASTDGALIAVSYSGAIISAFRNNGTWANARIHTPDSPALTGTPTAPTAASGTNTTQIATTAFVTAAIQALTTKSVSHTATAGSNITTLELTAVKVGNVVNLYLVFIPTNNMAYTGDVICSNMEYLPYNGMQLPAFCVSGNHLGQTTRLMLAPSGQIQTHYSGPTPEAGEAWFVNTTYICN